MDYGILVTAGNVIYKSLEEIFPHRAKKILLRKHAYSNTLRILPPKNENYQLKNSGSFHISTQNIDCGYLLEPPRRGGSNEYQ